MTRTAIIGLATAAIFAGPAAAHHSFAIFDQSKVNYVTGTVKQFEMVNPHAWLHLVIADDKGQAATWSFEGGSTAQLASLGWTPQSFKPGEKVQIGFRPMKDGSRGGQIMNVKTAAGQKLCSNRGCGDGSGQILAPF
jgi:Family of unknown function (DUF6152)